MPLIVLLSKIPWDLRILDPEEIFSFEEVKSKRCIFGIISQKNGSF